MIDLKAHSVKEIKEWLYHGSDDVSSLLKAMQEDSRISVCLLYTSPSPRDS